MTAQLIAWLAMLDYQLGDLFEPSGFRWHGVGRDDLAPLTGLTLPG